MKKRVIKDFNNLSDDIQKALRNKYPQGYIHHIITFFDKDKHLISALPYETEEVSYLIKMPASLYLDEDDDDSGSGLESFPESESLDNLDDEKYLIQEEEEEESD